ncbi:winged helix-turn-helix domain-containing protein [Aggregatilinea lenta]|uniref:winged helix-turn-helix domain-containing protein n=1 Tax=Aggregatilinea lenta TaxID=913108 RepID=UPI0013C36E4A|nr:crosslink repair DNA glycosylase YcaQ family protein [Aggregatilinea lenta]
MPATPQPLPLTAVRAAILHAQGLALPNGAEPDPTPNLILRTVEQLGCVQIDTLQRVHRSQYVALWSRLGTYDPADFDRLIYDPDQRTLFEYWQHAASIIPLSEYRYRLQYMKWFRDGTDYRDHVWQADMEDVTLAEQVQARILDEGPLRVADFEHDGGPRGTWWDWKPAKRALEYLYNRGELMIADRVHFHRVYDLRERVLPDWVDTSEPTMEETYRHMVERSVYALGLADPGHAADYAYDVKRKVVKRVADDLLAEGVLVEVEAELMNGKPRTLIAHRDRLPLLEGAADGAIQAERTTFLSPFDSLFWAKGRDRAVWGFRQVLEAYKPAPTREYGYFCLAILHRDRLVGRFDPKVERANGVLRIEALYLEPDVAPDEDLIAGVAAAMRDFMRFHNADTLVIERSDPAAFGEKLLAAL